MFFANSTGGEDDGRSDEGDGHDSEEEELQSAITSQALSPIHVPDTLPDVPILAIGRNPVFPRFVKMLEVSVAIIRC